MASTILNEHLGKIRDTMVWAIMAKAELEAVTLRIEDAARHGLPAKSLVDLELLPRPIDLDTYDTAELILLLDMQERKGQREEASR